jgi:pyruvate dehydrogenase E2 component (dihydrolipoamide acetyltransferase)
MAVPVIMPKMEMSQEAATVIEWLKRDGDHVAKGEPLLTVETDKVTVDIESPASGILAGVCAEPQQVVPVTEVIAYILQPGEELPLSVPPTHAGKENGISPARRGDIPSSPEPILDRAPAAATPVARRLASAHGVDLSTVVGTGAGGRIIKTDVELVLTAPPPSVLESRSGKVRATPAARRIARERGVELRAVAGSGPRGRVQAVDVLMFKPSPAVVCVGPGEVVPLAGIRRTIAERMTVSYQTTPHIALTVPVDMRGLEETRAQLNAKAEVSGQTRASVTALIVKAVAWALRLHPWLNSTLRDEEIHLLPEINVGVAVALEEGLIVPVVHQADRKGVSKIAAEVKDLTVRAHEGRLTPADVAGGTFTVSNLGPLGIEQFTAIINPPEAAILAVGATQPEVIVDEEGQVVVCPVMRMTLSADHRIVDGAVAARFLSDLRKVLEAPAPLLW